MSGGAFAYSFYCPVDFFGCFNTLPRWLEESLKDFGDIDGYNPEDELITLMSAAEEAAKKLGWEGDRRGPTRCFPVFTESRTDPELAVIWKQDNNGQTFVASFARMDFLLPLSGNWIDGEGTVLETYL